MPIASCTALPAVPSPVHFSQLRTVIGAFRVSCAISAIAELGIADILAAGPQPIAALAAATTTDEDALCRVVRLLVGAGLFVEVAPRRFALTALGACLRQDIAGSVRPLALNMLNEPRWRAWGHLLHSVRTHQPGFTHAHGMGLFDYMRDHPDTAARFNDAMTSEASRSADSIVEACDLRGVRRLVDVGGGHGALLAAILTANPDVHGVLFDAPDVIAGAAAVPLQAAVGERMELVPGDFFGDVPTGDAYLLRHVLHNWDDADATAILKNCRRAVGDGGKVLVVERPLMSDYRQDSPGLMLDVQMLVMLGGRERTEAEYAALFSAAGLQLRTVTQIDSLSHYRVLVGVPI